VWNVALLHLQAAGGGLLVLGPLDDDHAVALACAALGVRSLGAGLQRAVCSTCQGNPFFIKEVCATLVDR
jgi:predicted ATPase